MKVLFIGIAVIIGTFVFIFFYGQKKVQNKAYGSLLRTVLKHNVKEVTVKNIQNHTSTVFLDCRAKEEFSVSHLKGARWTGHKDFSLEALSDLPKNTPIIAYCSIGYRSEEIALKLLDAGYTDVKNLYGGIFEWKNQSRPIYDSIGATDKVHAYDKTWGIWLTNGEKIY